MKSTARLLVCLLPAGFLALHRLDSADIWFHLATGERTLTTHALPSGDPFAALPHAGPWIVHDWLAGVLFALLHRAGGVAALVLSTALAFVAALAWPSWRAHRAGLPTWPFEIAILVATGIAYERFIVRPEVFTLLFATLWMQSLVEGGPRRARDLAGLGLLQVAWTNLHAAFPLGPATAALALAGDAADRVLGRRVSIPRPRLLLPAVAALACLVSPYGPRLLLHIASAWRDVGTRELRAGIVEWQPTFSQPIAGDPVLVLFVASLAGIVAALAVGRRHARGVETLLVAAVAVLACTSRRHLALYALTVPPIAARWVASAWAARTAAAPAGARLRLRRAGAFVLPALALVFAIDVARGAFYARFGPPRTLGCGVSETDHPIGAGEFVARQRLAGPLFNNIVAGSYLIWRLRGDLPVLVDGRLLDPETFRAYRRCLESTAAFDAFAATHDVRLVVLALQPFPPAQLVRHLGATPAWRLVFLDGEGAVFVRAETLAARPELVPLALDAALPATGAPVGAAATTWRHCDPGEAARRGEMLQRLGFAAAARADLTRALAHCPDRWELGLPLASALLALGEFAAAEPLVLRVLDHDARNVDAWVARGYCRATAGDRAGARAAWERAAALAPGDTRPVFLLRQLDGG